MLIISRSHIESEIRLDEPTKVSLRLEESDVSEDIHQFLQDKVDQLALSDDLKREILEFLKKGANGMLLWVQLVLEGLSELSGTSPVEIHTALKRFPKTHQDLPQGPKECSRELEV